MKAILRTIGYIFTIFLISATTVFSACGEGSNSSQKRKQKNSGWLGVIIQDVNEKISRKAKLDSEEGAYIKEVIENSPADSAGLKDGDVIIEYNGKKVFDADDLVKNVHRTAPGTKADLTVMHDGKKKTISLTVGRKKSIKQRMFGVLPDICEFVGIHPLGLKLMTLNEQLGEYFGTPNNEGVLVTEVEKESAAEKAGFKAGDVITRIGKKTIVEAEKLRRELQKYDEGETAEFEVIRKNSKKILSVEIEEEQSFRQNFFHREPRMQMFRMDPFDDEEIHIEMEKLQPEIDRLQRELEQTMKNIENKKQEIQEKVGQFSLSSCSLI